MTFQICYHMLLDELSASLVTVLGEDSRSLHLASFRLHLIRIFRLLILLCIFFATSVSRLYAESCEFSWPITAAGVGLGPLTLGFTLTMDGAALSGSAPFRSSGDGVRWQSRNHTYLPISWGLLMSACILPRKRWEGKIGMVHYDFWKLKLSMHISRRFQVEITQARLLKRKKGLLTFYPFPSTQRQSLFTPLVF